MERSLVIHEAGPVVLDQSLMDASTFRAYVRRLELRCDEDGGWTIETEPPFHVWPSSWKLGSILAGAVSECILAGHRPSTLECLSSWSAHAATDLREGRRALLHREYSIETVNATVVTVARLLIQDWSDVISTAERLTPIMESMSPGQVFVFDREPVSTH